eukprot:TRINITY_DN2610_c0_g2_i7.p1 TRINITY_DN2610_c0_g2~~TRINITY_DN2610_c0_g2_i7.p1  ORF type:complete len:226 (+),score=38.47 TRINITY_DN2610_c0_g2_i7:116-793(+)
MLGKAMQMDLELIEGFIYDVKEDGYKSVYDSIQGKKKDLQQALLKKFKNLFNKKEDGNIRNWRFFKEQEMQQLFVATKEECFQILEQLKNFSFSRYWTPGQSNTSQVQDVPHEFNIITEEEKQSLQAKFVEDADNEYADALRKRKEANEGGIPKFFWPVLVFFMYDDILQWAHRPIILYPLLFVLCIIGLFNAIGMGNVISLLIQQAISFVNEKFGPQLAKLGLK